MLMVNIVQEAAGKFVIRSVPRISRSFLRAAGKDKPDEWIITTEVCSLNHLLIAAFAHIALRELTSTAFGSFRTKSM